MFRRIAGVTAASVLACLMAGSPASAATTSTTITVGQARVALAKALSASKAAASQGAAARVSESFTNGKSDSYTTVVDGVHGRARSGNSAVFGYAAAGVGYWRSIAAPNSATKKAWLTLIGKPNATAAFYAYPKMTKANVWMWVTNPVEDITSTLGDTFTSARKAPHGTGIDYTVVARTTVRGKHYTYTETFTVAANGTLSGTVETSKDLGLKRATTSYTYGPQTVVLPAAATTVTSTQLATAQYVLAHFASLVKTWASYVADGARQIAAQAHRSLVTVSDVRTSAQFMTKGNVKSMLKVSTTAITGGVRLRAVNPLTHKAVTYTVTVKAGKVVVKAA